MKNCKNCIRFTTCVFVERNKEYTKQMYPMFEYAEQNNLQELFYNNASSCNHFIDGGSSIEKLETKLKTARYQMNWLKTHLTRPRVKPEVDEFFLAGLIKVVTEYEEKLNE